MFDNSIVRKYRYFIFYTGQGKNLPNYGEYWSVLQKTSQKLSSKIANFYIKFVKNGFYLKIHYNSPLYFKHRYNKLTSTQAKKNYIPGV